MKVTGYNYSPELLNSKVPNFKNLTPNSRHILRDILDLIWISEEMKVKEEASLVSYTGVTKREWTRIKQEILALPNKFIKLENGFWSSPWLEKQKTNGIEIIKNNPGIDNSYQFIESLSGNDENEEDKEDIELENYELESYNETKKRNEAKTSILYKERSYKKKGIKSRMESINQDLKKYAGSSNKEKKI